MATAGWSINAVGIKRLEKGERRVTADDLMALALALDVSPVSLLMPPSGTDEESVEATGVKHSIESRRLWLWLRADAPLLDRKPESFYTFLGRALPSWWLHELEFVEEGVEPNIIRYARKRGLAGGND